MSYTQPDLSQILQNESTLNNNLTTAQTRLRSILDKEEIGYTSGDGIIPLIFSEIDENTLEYNEKPFFIHFGETFTDVENILSAVGITFFDVEEVEKGDESAIDNLIDSMDDNEEEDDDGMEDF